MKRSSAVFLDRDGVINAAVVRDGKPYPPANLAALIIPDEVLPALNLLKNAGFLLIVVTNQPDIARGTTTAASVDVIHQHLLEKLPLDDIRVCAHDDCDDCACRKPLPGLLVQAAHEHNVALNKSYMIGDRWRDVEAGQAAGCLSIFLDYGYFEKKPHAPDYVAQSLQQAVDWITTGANRHCEHSAAIQKTI